jgi:membrane protease YdiL (CAAX protease family)
LNSPEIEPAFEHANEANEEISRRATIAPVWHTVVLVVFILAISIAGAYRNSGASGAVRVHKLETYAATAALEAAIVGWVAFGLRLRRIPLRSLFGAVPGDIRSIALDAGIAIVFWIGSMMALGTVALFWLGVETAITHRPLPISTGRVLTPDPSQEHAIHAVLRLAPSDAKEIAGWILLCLLVSVAEEVVFRGYLQRQFTAWARGAVAAGVVFSAITFGAAHGYEGIRSMFLLTLFGALFSLLAVFRKSLRAGIFAHGWHDVFAGLMVSLLHARHLL